jgi:hypothetical protein
MFRLQPNPGWTAPSGHPKALAEGLWTGAFAVALLTFAGLAGDAGTILAVALTAVLPGLLVPVSVGDILASRLASHPRLTLAIAAGTVLVAAWLAVGFVLPSGVPLPPQLDDGEQAALPCLAGLLLAAERLAARGRLAWRDRALGAAAGYATVAGVFVVGAEWLSWAVLLGVLPLRLPRSARVAFAALSGAAALGLGQFMATPAMGRLGEAAAFVLYAAASLALVRLRPAGPLPSAAPA